MLGPDSQVQASFRRGNKDRWVGSPSQDPEGGAFADPAGPNPWMLTVPSPELANAAMKEIFLSFEVYRSSEGGQGRLYGWSEPGVSTRGGVPMRRMAWELTAHVTARASDVTQNGNSLPLWTLPGFPTSSVSLEEVRH